MLQLAGDRADTIATIIEEAGGEYVKQYCNAWQLCLGEERGEILIEMH